LMGKTPEARPQNAATVAEHLSAFVPEDDWNARSATPSATLAAFERWLDENRAAPPPQPPSLPGEQTGGEPIVIDTTFDPKAAKTKQKSTDPPPPPEDDAPAAQEEPVAAGEDANSTEAGVSRKRRRWLRLLAVVAALALLVGVAWGLFAWFGQSEESNNSRPENEQIQGAGSTAAIDAAERRLACYN